MNVPEKRPRVGLGIFIYNEKGQLLLIKRTSKHAHDTWAPPGGYLEYGESFEEGAKREVKEELDIEVEDLEIIGLSNSIYPEEKKHIIAILLKASRHKGDIKIMEPEKCSEFDWFDINNLPQPLMKPIKDYFNNSKWAYKLKIKLQ